MQNKKYFMFLYLVYIDMNYLYVNNINIKYIFIV